MSPASSSRQNTQTIVAGIKLGIFVLVSLLVTGTLTAIMGSFSFGSETEYKADFATASMIQKGDDVRVAGVTVGSVKKVQIMNRTDAEITFKVKKSLPLTTDTRASVRYLNLVGDRYMALDQGDPGAGRLAKGATIPMSQTTPALNLTELFNGFQPLFQALQPNEVNQLSLNLIKVLQGEGGTIGSLLDNTASLTNALADRDELIGKVVDNLSSLLKTVDDRHAQLSTLVIELRKWLTNVAQDRGTIGDSVESLSGLSAELAKLLTLGRPYVKADVAQLRRLTTILNKPKNQAVLDEVLNRLPDLLTRQTRTGTYGSWYQYYLCDFDGKIILPDLIPGKKNSQIPGLAEIDKKLKNLSFFSSAKRCDT